jgi:uncharacterized repeat protein (TIGR02543 family)
MIMKTKKLYGAVIAAVIVCIAMVITIIADEPVLPLETVSAGDVTLIVTDVGKLYLSDGTELTNPVTVGGGTISMDVMLHTLTVDNVNFTTTADTALAIRYDNPMTVQLIGENSFTSTNDGGMSYGLTIANTSYFVFVEGSALKLQGNTSASFNAITYAANLLYREKADTDSDFTYSLDTVNTGTGSVTAKTVEIYSSFNTVTFESNGGTAVSPIYKVGNDTPGLPAAPTRDGYTFSGWYSDNGTFEIHVTSLDSITESTTLYAKWDYNGLYTETLRFDPSGDLYIGSLQLPDAADVGGGTIAYDNTQNTLTFTGVNFTTSAETAFQIDQSVEVVLVGDNSITSTFIEAGSSIAAYQTTGTLTVSGSGTLRLLGNTYAANSNITFGPNVLYREKEFIDSEWAYFIDDTAPLSKGAGTVAAEITTDYAVVTLNPNNEEATATLYRFADEVPVLPVPTKEGLYFDGWYDTDTKVTALDTLAGNISLEAKWTDTPEDNTDSSDQGNSGSSGNSGNSGYWGGLDGSNASASAEGDSFTTGVMPVLVPVPNADGSLSVTSYSGIVATIYPNLQGASVRAGVNLTGSVNSQSTAAAVSEAVKLARARSARSVTLQIPDGTLGFSVHTAKKLFAAAGGLELIIECPTLENGNEIGKISMTITEETGQILTGLSFGTERIEKCDDYVTRLFGAEVIGGFETAQKGGFGDTATITVNLSNFGIIPYDGTKFYVMIYDTRTGKWYDAEATVKGLNAVIETERSGIFLILKEMP